MLLLVETVCPVVQLQDDLALQVRVEGEIGPGLAAATQEVDDLVLANALRPSMPVAAGNHRHRRLEGHLDRRRVARKPVEEFLLGDFLTRRAAGLQLDPEEFTQKGGPQTLSDAVQVIFCFRSPAGRPLGPEAVAKAIKLDRERQWQLVMVEWRVVFHASPS